MDIEKIEQEAKDHSTEVDKGLGDVETKADKEADGKDHGMIDKGIQEVEKQVGGPQETPPAA